MRRGWWILIILLHSSALTSLGLNFSSTQCADVHLVCWPALVISWHDAAFPSRLWWWMRDLHPEAGTYSLLLTDRVLESLNNSQALIFLSFGNLRQELLFNIFSVNFLLFDHLTSGILSVLFLLLFPLIIQGDFFVCSRLESRIIKKVLLSNLFSLELFKVLEPFLLSQLLIPPSMILKIFFRHWLLAGFDLVKFLFALFL